MHDKIAVKNINKTQKYYNGLEIRSIIHEETLINVGNEIVQYLDNYISYKIQSVNKNKRYQVWTNNQLTIGGQSGR